MASKQSSSGSHSRRNADARGGVANVDDADTNSMNHPELHEPETTEQLENAVHTESGQAVPQTVIQQGSKSQSEVIADPPPRQQKKVISAEVVSTEKGAIHKYRGIPTIVTRNKDKVEVPHSPPVNMPLRRNPPRRVREKIVSSCGLCVEADNDRMVQCDGCETWYHFDCVDVSESIAEISWVCPGCANVTTIKTPGKNQKSSRDPATTGVNNNQPPNLRTYDAASSRSAGRSSRRSDTKRRIELQLQKLEEERKLQLKYLEQKYSLLEELESEGSSVASDIRSFVDNASKVEHWMANTDNCGDDSGLVDNLEDEAGCSNEEVESESREKFGVHANLPSKRTTPRMQNRTFDLQIPFSQPSREELALSKQRMQYLQATSYAANATTRPLREATVPLNQRMQGAKPISRPEVRFQPETPLNFIPRQGSTPVYQSHTRSVEPSVVNEVDEIVYSLNRSQLAARQAVSKDLPEFSGNPEDWPLFFSIFNSSTQLCGFSNEENMLRLRKCLTGKALDAVKCRLLHPSNVQGIITTLKMLYGRPEAIIQAIVRKIRSLQPPQIEKLDTVIQFALSVENLVATVEACEIGDFMYNASLRYELVEQLPPTLKLDWAKTTRNIPSPNLSDFSSWLRSIAEDASAVTISTGSEHRSRAGKKDGYLNHHAEEDPTSNVSNAQTSQKSTKEAIRECVGCKGSCTNLAQCERFKELGCDSKWAVVREFKVCRKCLRQHNGPCKQRKECGTDGCSFLHHPLLHSERKQATSSTRISTTIPTQPQSNPTTNTSSTCNVHQAQSEILFRIVPVLLHGPSKTLRTYAFVDDGSELTLMERGLANDLGLQGPEKSLCLRWTGGTNRTEDLSQLVNLQVSSVADPTKKFELSAVHTVENLQLRPQTLLIPEMQKKYRHLDGLPLESYQDVSPRLLIGLDHASLGKVMKCREGKLNEPLAVKTRLGWTIYGSCARDKNASTYINHHSVELCQCNEKSDEDLHDAMKQYFSLESLGISKPNQLLLSNKDRRANDLLETLTTRTNGRYKSGLLWRYDNVRLPDSKNMALRRWECLDRRMQKDHQLAQALNEKITDYLSKGYIRKLSPEELESRRNRIWYLPMFPVVNPNKPGKTRLVWDAAATSHGVSLNSVLLKGPDQLAPLLSVLIRFREFRVAVSGDIREMYHQVQIREPDQHCQRFLWKENETDSSPSTYVIQVMSFGACCSPSIAQYVKNTHALKYEHNYPEAVHAIIYQHYVDDMLISAETEEKATQLAADVKKIHESGGFEMRNWVSNSKVVVAALEGDGTQEKNMSIGGADTTEKVLGMWWDTSSDCFTFKLSSRHDAALLSGSKRPTKREVLRTLMMVFDPLGLISHFLMFLRTLLQEIWRSSVDWDEQIHDPQFEKWLTWLRVLPQVANIKIPRCYRTVTSSEESNVVQMHTFVDASENGFAAAVYLRFQQGRTVECTLAGAKTRVAPLKFLSIPRSELQAAVIGVRLADTILGSLTTKIQNRFFWTDSRDVMCWLHSDHRRYSPYVGVRITEILDTTNLGNWRWVPTKLNVADEGTKWKNTPNLSISSRWFRGPEFLRKPEEDWPASHQSVPVTDTELRPYLHLHVLTPAPIIDVSRFSRWADLLKTTAYVFRAIKNLQCNIKKTSKTTGPLTSNEFAVAECYLLQTAQRSAYNEEILMMCSNSSGQSEKRIPKSSPLSRLCPFIDEKGVLRIRGRTKACPFVDSSNINPIILPREHGVTKLLAFDVHQKFLHQNHETAINELKQRYYIPRIKAVYKSIRSSCQFCKNERARPIIPLMSDLPPCRLAVYSRPFSHMGVDYFGPMTVSIGRRTEKRWGVLVTCLTIRAIHLEIAHSLSADSCIMALRNVIARRGTPITIYSDRGTNFVGSNKELKEALKRLDQDKIMKEFTSTHTSWSFIPPLSPHMGGAWERLIRTVKNNLGRLNPNRILTDETLRNMLIEVEQIVNSRPLTEIPLDDDQSPVLTPNHFIMGSSNGLPPWTSFDDNPAALKENWRLSQAMANQFWKQWLHDYLPSITRRAKWFTEVKPIKINDIVVIVDERLPRNCWPKGRVIATKVAHDGQVRGATVQTANGIYERPAVKLAVLDVGVSGNATQTDLRCIEGGTVDGATSNCNLTTPLFTPADKASHPHEPLEDCLSEDGRTEGHNAQ